MIAKARPPAAGQVKKAPVDAPLRFSFSLFDHTDDELCPPSFADGYTRALMQRLRDLSQWTVREFTAGSGRSTRCHQHDWSRTSRPGGFPNLNATFQAMPSWQFSVSANEHGRVHGILIDDTFYIIWLDERHRLYPGRS